MRVRGARTRVQQANLRTLSGGSAVRAAFVLVVAHLVPALVMLAIWAVGLLPIFDGVRWVPAGIAGVVGIAMLLGLFLFFGFWGTPATGGRDHGEEPMASFGPGRGFALGWLRWAMQLVAVALAMLGFVLVFANLRPWHFVGTDELRDLPERAKAIPVPSSWTLVDVERSGYGLSNLVDPSDTATPEGYVEQTFEVPEGYAYDDLRSWIDGPAWTADGGDEAFGAVERERCDRDTASCDVRLIPPAGEEPEHFVAVDLDEQRDVVDVRLTYRAFVPPDYEVSDETVERFAAIPIPDGWVEDSVVEGSADGRERFTRFYGVPDDYTADDLEAWFRGTDWTDPPSGGAFGALEDPECGVDDINEVFRCSATVARDDPDDRPIESVRASLDDQAEVRVNLGRNG